MSFESGGHILMIVEQETVRKAVTNQLVWSYSIINSRY